MVPTAYGILWLSHFSVILGAIGTVAIGATAVAGDLLLGAATSSAHSWCGVMEGQVRTPVNLTLPGIDFAASRWTPGDPVDPDAVSACPDPTDPPMGGADEAPAGGGQMDGNMVLGGHTADAPVGGEMAGGAEASTTDAAGHAAGGGSSTP